VTDLRLRIAAKRMLTDRIAEFRLEPEAGGPLPRWEPGAHLRISLPEGGDRAYSLVSFGPVPDEPDHYLIAVQREAEGAGGSKAMHALAVGDTVSATAPKCDFPVTPGAPAVLLAGGIGITPMISMAAALAASGTPVELHYAGRSRGVMAYADALSETLGGTLTLHCDDDENTALNLGALLGALGERHLYICGPRGLIDAARTGAEAAGIPSGRVHVELFDNLSSGASAPAAEGDQPFDVEVASTGEVFTIPPGRSIIEVLEEGGMDLIHDCLRGDCGICQTEVLEGIPDHRDVVLSQAERAEGKLMQICVSRAKSARLKLDL